jgi:uncharacterized protein (DUF1501 family)
MQRRDFLKLAAGTLAGALLPIGRSGWAFAAPGASPKRLIVVLLRGAIDGLSVVVPYAEEAYYAGRSTIAVPPPGSTGGAIALADGFGLSPALRPLMPLWQSRQLAFVHACGLPEAGRSHFEAQDEIEAGVGSGQRAGDGWLNRTLAQLPAGRAHQAVSLGATTPRIVSGPRPVATLPVGRQASQKQPLDRPEIQAAFDRMYAGDDPLAKAYHEGREARQALLADMAAINEEQRMADNGAPSAIGFAADARRLAQLMATDPAIQVAFLSLGGWDTHVNQGGSQGALSRNLKALGEGLAALASGLGPVFDDTAIVVMSEFGRTVRENGNNGTDHGYGNAMWLLGGRLAGGRFYGRWPGLADAQLYQGRDLAVTTDYRQVAGAVLAQHLGLGPAQLARVFPSFALTPLEASLFRA